MKSYPPEAPGSLSWLAAYAISMVFAIVFGEWTAPVVVIAVRLLAATLVPAIATATLYITSKITSDINDLIAAVEHRP